MLTRAGVLTTKYSRSNWYFLLLKYKQIMHYIVKHIIVEHVIASSN